MKHEPKDSKQQEWPEGLFEFNQKILNQFPDMEELRVEPQFMELLT